MDSHTIELLEFSTVLQELAGFCFSPQGSRRLLNQQILTQPEEVQIRLGLAADFRRLLESAKPFPVLDCPDLASLQSRMTKPGTCFDQEELSRLGRFTVSAGRLKRFLGPRSLSGVALSGSTSSRNGGRSSPKQNELDRSDREHDSSPPASLTQLAAGIPVLKELVAAIFTVVDREGNLKEKNLPTLRGIKKRIRALQQQMDHLARDYLVKEEHRGFWQTDTATQKDGRTVLPLKSNFKGRIQGLVHEVSASGATIYIEPLDIVEKNNELVQWQNQYRIEVQRILRDLSARVVARGAKIEAMVETVGELDTLYARAGYARKMRCHPAGQSPGLIDLREARHPLIGREVVPISLFLDRHRRVLIITGPNTGGKTVTLKTLGLLALMHQFGMEIPAQEGSCLPVFDNVLADIGDEQSIEQSLSTFSAHMINISRIIRESSSGSLILCDELGAGTDPEEGVAIAMALLDHFIEKGCLTLATTHHGILKNYGYSRTGVENASMEFDLANLAPTYKIIMGMPGESHALEIARRNGLPEDLVRRARNYLQDERGDLSELIRSLTQKQRELLDSQREAQQRAHQLREKNRETDLKALKLRQKERELREQGLRELKTFLKDSRRELEGLVREIREGELNRAKTESVRDFARKLESRIREEEKELAAEALEFPAPPGIPLKVGMAVQILGTGRQGRILRQGRGGSWIVETDTLRGSFQAEELKPIPVQAPVPEHISIVEELVTQGLSYELDLRGLRLEEAIGRLEKQIDSALIRGLGTFSVIHGKGEGVLQQGVHGYLEQRREVKEFFFSPPQEGGFGKTVVRL